MECFAPLKTILDNANLVMNDHCKACFLASAPGQNLWLEAMHAVANVSNTYGHKAEDFGPVAHTGEKRLCHAFGSLRQKHEHFDGWRALEWDSGPANVCRHHNRATWANGT